MRIFILALCILLTKCSFGQSHLIDSLKIELTKANNSQDSLSIETSLAHYCAECNLDSSLFYSKHIIKRAKQISDSSFISRGYYKTAFAYYLDNYSKHYDLVWSYLDTSFQYATSNQLSHYYLFSSILHNSDKNYDKSNLDLMKATEIARQQNDTIVIAYCILNMFYIYYEAQQTEKFKQIISNNQDVIEAVKGNNIYWSLQLASCDMYHYIGEYAKAANTYTKIMDPYIKRQTPFQRIIYYQNLANYYNKLNRLDSAAWWFNETINISYDSVSNAILSNKYILLAEYLINQNEFNKARQYLKQTEHYVSDIKDPNILMQTYLLYSESYKAESNYKKSLEYIEKYMALKESVNPNKAGDLIDEYISEKELKEIEKELILLRDQQIQKVSRRTVLLILVFVSLFGISLIWYFLSKLLGLLKPEDNNVQKKSFKFLAYVPESYKMNKLFHLGFSLIFGALIQSIYFGLMLSVEWSWLQLPVFAASVFPFYFIELYLESRRLKNHNLIMRKEFILRLIALIAFIVFLSSILSRVYRNTELLMSFEFATSVVAANIITAIAMVLVRYRYAIIHIYNKAINEYNHKPKSRPLVENNATKNATHQLINIDNQGVLVEVDLNKLLFIKSDNIYQEFYFSEVNEAKKVLIRSTMSCITDSLKDYPHFFRCHRSYIVNLEKVKTIEGPAQKNYFTLKDCNEMVPISRTVGKQLLSEFHNSKHIA